MTKPPPQALMVDPESFRGSPLSVTPNPDRRKCVSCGCLPACTEDEVKLHQARQSPSQLALSICCGSTCRKLYEMAEIYGQVSASIHDARCL